MADIPRESIRTFASQSIPWIRTLRRRGKEGAALGGEDSDKNNRKKLREGGGGCSIRRTFIISVFRKMTYVISNGVP